MYCNLLVGSGMCPDTSIIKKKILKIMQVFLNAKVKIVK